MLQDSRVKPDVETFNALIDAWAKSSYPDAVEQAFAVISIMEEDAKCLELGLRPDAITFSTLLKCLAASKSSYAGKRAEDVLDDIERRHSAGDTDMKPDVIAYTLAIVTAPETQT